MNENYQPLNHENGLSYIEVLSKIKNAWRYLLSKWFIILIASFIGGAGGFIYGYVKKPIFIAQLSFALQDDKSVGGFSGALSLASQFGIDLGGGGAGGEFSGDNLLELMKSRLIIEKTLLSPVYVDGKKETLIDLYINFNKFRDNWIGKPGLESIKFSPGADLDKFTLKQDSIIGVFHRNIIKNNLSVDKLDKKLSIVSIKVTSTNELFSKYFAEVLEKVVSDFYIQTKTTKSAKNVSILQYQVDSVRTLLNAAILGVASSTDANPNPNPLFQTLRVPSQRKSVDIQFNTVILTELVKNLAIAKMSLLQETPLIQVIDKPILPLERIKVSKLYSGIKGAFIAGFIISVILFIKKIK
ncbi:GumC domain-containing protein [Mucilaginibacter boryungensis]|uniref:Lipopolysaccharide biosynthesis protein n=1 Tax=Mucilaginibacter boryungensis TaxID=768480 RepID=A0ABR9XEM1_9SPHI|nr:lipopolysaccharide biosynthesis protein [Mucilaginibacter boryungensis]MBE9665834.1 lipopolysaccharide biosynthesis protein [Mucilaginibacter boryungensis]